jgi:ligand-binding sensor domain-containing protein
MMASTDIVSYSKTGGNQIVSAYGDDILPVGPRYAGWHNIAAQRAVRDLAVSSVSGHLWAATWGGVLAWDRHNERGYRRYLSEHGLPGNSIAHICMDAHGDAWAAGSEGGLASFDGSSWYIYADPRLHGQLIHALSSAGARGGIYAATPEAVYHIPGLTEQATEVNAAPGQHVSGVVALLAEGAGVLAAGAAGVFRLQPQGSPDRLAPEMLADCTALAHTGDGRLWAATSDAVYALDQLAARLSFRVSPGRVIALSGGRQRLWVLMTTGLAYFEHERWIDIPWTNRESPNPGVQAIAASNSDTYLWLGTTQGLAGVHCAAGKAPRWDMGLLPPSAAEAPTNAWNCIWGPDPAGRMWVGGAGGVYSCAPDGSWEVISASNTARGLAMDDAGTVWQIGWPVGIRPLSEGVAPSLRGLPLALAADVDGRIHCITQRALWRLDDGQWQEVAGSCPAAPRCLEQTGDGRWWLGTDQGVYRLVAGCWQQAGEQPGPRCSLVEAMSVSDSALWVAAENGLWMWRGDAWIDHGMALTLEPGGEGGVQALGRATNGKLWLAREDALVEYDAIKRTIDQNRRFTPLNSGLGSLRITALAEASGYLWVCTRAGLSWLDLSTL